MLKLDMDDEQLHGFISEAILRSLDEKRRDVLIQGALEYLLTPGEGYSGKKASPLEDAFKMAVRHAAQTMAKEAVENDPRVKEQIQGLLAEAMERVFVANREKTVEKIAESITNAMECHGNRY